MASFYLLNAVIGIKGGEVLLFPRSEVDPLFPDKIHPSAADARGDGDSAANGIGDVGYERTVHPIALLVISPI